MLPGFPPARCTRLAEVTGLWSNSIGKNGYLSMAAQHPQENLQMDTVENIEDAAAYMVGLGTCLLAQHHRRRRCRHRHRHYCRSSSSLFVVLLLAHGVKCAHACVPSAPACQPKHIQHIQGPCCRSLQAVALRCFCCLMRVVSCVLDQLRSEHPSGRQSSSHFGNTRALKPPQSPLPHPQFPQGYLGPIPSKYFSNKYVMTFDPIPVAQGADKTKMVASNRVCISKA